MEKVMKDSGTMISKTEMVQVDGKSLGKYKYENGEVYEGDWKEDQRDGKGNTLLTP
jgi:hypothetical protein